MARTATINKAERVHANAVKLQAKRKEWKKMLLDASLPPEKRREAQKRLVKTRAYSLVRVRRRCQINGRGQGVYRRFGMSRNMIRKMMMEGLFPGGRKSSW